MSYGLMPDQSARPDSQMLTKSRCHIGSRFHLGSVLNAAIANKAMMKAFFNDHRFKMPPAKILSAIARQ